MKTQRGRRLWWLIRLIAWLPLPLAAGLGAILGDLITRVPLRYASAYRVVLINLLATQPGISFEQARLIGRHSLRELGRSFCEFAHVWSRSIDETMARITRIHGEQEYLDACASDQPVLLLSLHLGSWETMNPYLGRQGTTIMYQPHPATLVDELVKQARERSGCRLIPTNNQGIKHGLATLRAGGTLALLADHNPGNRSNPYAPFFGHPVPTRRWSASWCNASGRGCSWSPVTGARAASGCGNALPAGPGNRNRRRHGRPAERHEPGPGDVHSEQPVSVPVDL